MREALKTWGGWGRSAPAQVNPRGSWGQAGPPPKKTTNEVVRQTRLVGNGTEKVSKVDVASVHKGGR